MPRIYKIMNSVNDKLYIGQTTKPLNKRMSEHRYGARTAKHFSHLYNAMNKYGSDVFSIELIEECLIELLDEREKFWIAKLNTLTSGYNLTSGGQGVQKRHDTMKRLGKMSPFCGHASPHRRAVKQFNLNGDLLQEFPSVLAASIAMSSASCTGIRGCCKGRAKTAFGFIWKYADDASSFISPFKHPVRQLSLDDKLIREFTSIRGAADCTNAHYGSIHKVLRGINKTAGGFKWELIE